MELGAVCGAETTPVLCCRLAVLVIYFAVFEQGAPVLRPHRHASVVRPEQLTPDLR